ncbi:branched-chain amino acid ABC transporter substrate-binding protein [Floricoccus penangensis]|uniref:Branched-chain amino acid ABC transporter substrate-binding protein n=1 Tax=Floricoccus penangensis TaxID=1859475 RepID=A0A9Q5NYT6_9LACT|nr:ABC transporter substrate-binding protein [Floricoccus penangensis]OFI45934.1 branched-chain amino acid ABC transporter substrate-binding protein [Floricoccus penangensis]
MKKVVKSALAVLATLSLAGCAQAPIGAPEGAANNVGDTFKIGYNLELTGAVAAYGSQEKMGADLAVKEINESGGINGKKIEVVSKDNKSDNAEAASVASSLVSNDKVVAAVGPATSGAAKATIPNMTQAGVPLITPSGSDDSLTLMKNGRLNEFAFRTIFQDSDQGRIISTYVTNNLKAQKVLIYYDNSSDYAKGIYSSFKKNFKGDIVDTVTFQSGDKDFQATLSKVKKLNYDAIVMPGYYNETGLITKQARELGITAPIIGGDGFASDTYVQLSGKKAATDVHYVAAFSPKAPASSKTEPFIKNFKKANNQEPSAFAALAYDAVYMIKEAAEKGKVEDSAQLAKELAQIKDFNGVTGVMTIDKNHNPIKSAVIVTLDNGVESKAEVVNPE